MRPGVIAAAGQCHRPRRRPAGAGHRNNHGKALDGRHWIGRGSYAHGRRCRASCRVPVVQQLRRIHATHPGRQVVTGVRVVAALEVVPGCVLDAGAVWSRGAGYRVITNRYIVKDRTRVAAVVQGIQLCGRLSQPAAGLLLDQRQNARECRRSGGRAAITNEEKIAIRLRLAILCHSLALVLSSVGRTHQPCCGVVPVARHQRHIRKVALPVRWHSCASLPGGLAVDGAHASTAGHDIGIAAREGNVCADRGVGCRRVVPGRLRDVLQSRPVIGRRTALRSTCVGRERIVQRIEIRAAHRDVIRR